MLQKSRSCLLPWSIYNLSKYSQYSAEFQCCLLYTNIATSTVFYLTLPYMIVLPTSLIVMRNKPSKGVTYVQILNFKPLSFPVLRSKPCRSQDFTIVFVLLFSVAVAVSIHLWAVCRHFCCPISLFQGHVWLVVI